MSTLERAIAIAATAHAGQVDKAGAPYILHPLRVMLSCTTIDERIVAVLHDVVEDTSVTMVDVEREGFAPHILAALAAVTKVEGEAYADFVLRAAADPIGRQVKLADLRDNVDLSRIAVPTTHDQERAAKYRRAIASIKDLA